LKSFYEAKRRDFFRKKLNIDEAIPKYRWRDVKLFYGKKVKFWAVKGFSNSFLGRPYPLFGNFEIGSNELYKKNAL